MTTKSKKSKAIANQIDDFKTSLVEKIDERLDYLEAVIKELEKARNGLLTVGKLYENQT